MNMAIRGTDFDFGKEPADTFTRDQYPDLRADFVMANPPFNIKEWWDCKLEGDARWKYDTPQQGNASTNGAPHLSPGQRPIRANLRIDFLSLLGLCWRHAMTKHNLADENWDYLPTLLPADWQELAKTAGGVRRPRGATSLSSLLRTLLLHIQRALAEGRRNRVPRIKMLLS